MSMHKSNFFCLKCNIFVKCPLLKHPHIFGIIKEYDASTQQFSTTLRYIICYECKKKSTDSSVSIPISQGGKLTYYPSLLSEEEHKEISTYMDNSSHFRQYRIQNMPEKRQHFLLSTNINNGYIYHNVKMKAVATIASVPCIKNLALRLGQQCQLPNSMFNIGVDVIYYRNGNDKIGWHADDNQGEDIIFAVVIQTDENRKVCVRQTKDKKEKNKHGDKVLQLFFLNGDGYSMDGEFYLI